MTQGKWRAWFEAIGISAVVVSLVFVGVQLRQEQEFAAGQYAYNWLGAKVELTGLIAENKAIWVAGLKGEDLSEVDSVVFNTMVSDWIGFQTARYQNRLLVSGGNASAVALDVANSIHAYSGLKRYWRWHIKYYAELHGGVGGMALHVDQLLKDIESGKRKHFKDDSFIIM